MFISSLYYIRWNIFGSLPPIHITTEHAERELLVETVLQRQAHSISFNNLIRKTEREAPPPPYEDPPPYHVALAIWGCPNTIVSQPVIV